MLDNGNPSRIHVSAEIVPSLGDEGPPHNDNELSGFGKPLAMDPHEFDFLATTLTGFQLSLSIICQISERRPLSINSAFVDLSPPHVLLRRAVIY